MQNRLGLPHIYDSRHRDRLFLPALQQVVLDLKVTKGDNLRVPKENYDQERGCSVLFKFKGEFDICVTVIEVVQKLSRCAFAVKQGELQGWN